MSVPHDSVLTIAGSDPSGGAGIQADLRVFAAFGLAGLSAITALTVQNSQGVLAMHPVSAEALFAQLDALLSDSKVMAVKIGMLGGLEQVRVVIEILRRYAPPNVVLDPVLASTDGVPLLSEPGRRLLLSELLPLCCLITPNVPELALLTGMPVETAGERIQAARKLLCTGIPAVLVKGGHLKDRPTDVLVTAHEQVHSFEGIFIATQHTHGTGCFLSSAIAANLARQHRLELAIREAKHLLAGALMTPVIAGKGRGYPGITPQVGKMEGDELQRLEHLKRTESMCRGALYVVTDSVLRPDRSLEEITIAALAGGARVIQLREKGRSTPELIELAKRLVLLTREAGALLIVNDRVDAALAADADGVHLGPDDMRPEDARRLLGPERILGVSVNSVEEAAAAAPYASYLGVGAIFGSRTKLDAGSAIGTGRISEIKRAFPDYSLAAIGGIDAENISEVAAAGADMAAVVSAVVAAPDMRLATADLLKRFHAGLSARPGNSAPDDVNLRTL